MLYNRSSLHTPFSFKDKIRNLDFVLLFSILLLGIISIFAQFSSSGGVFDYYSKSHAVRFGIFFILFLVISFTSDWRFSSSRSKEMVKGLLDNNINVCYAEVSAESGHDAFLMSDNHYHEIIKSFFNHVFKSK